MMRCPNCQQERWEEGVVSEARANPVSFKPKRSKFLVLSYPEIAAQACTACGYVILTLDVEKLKKTLKD